MLRQLREAGRPPLVVDSGDTLYPRTRSPFDKKARLDSRARFVIEALGEAGLDAWCPSLLDLRLGSDALSEQARQAGVPLVATNLSKADGQPAFARHLVVERAGLRIGILGLVGVRKGVERDVAVGDPAEAARDALAMLAGKVDLVIALSNLGLERDRRLAAEVEGLLAILGAGDDRMILVPRRVEQTLILQAYKQGEYLGLLRLSLMDPPGPMLDELDRLRLERQLTKLPAGSPEAAGLRAKLEAFTGRSTFRAVLRPLSEEDPSDEGVARAVAAQLESEAVPP